MEFITVRDLRTRPSQIWDKLRQQHDLILTSSGRPIAVLSHIDEGGVEETLAALRRARAQAALSRLRADAAAQGRGRLSADEIEDEIAAARAERAKAAPGESGAMIVVVDTNVLVSGLLSAHGTPARVLDLLTTGDLRAAYDDRIAAEYRQVLARPRFGFQLEAVAHLLDYLFDKGLPLVTRPLPATLPDPDDQPFWEVAVEAAAPLITGNLKHFPAEVCTDIEVLTHAAFIERWRRGHS